VEHISFPRTLVPEVYSLQAIVLVGGEGTRLRPLTYGTPKPMVPIMGVPFLARTMERLYVAGIREVILPAGYMPQAIVDYFGDGSRLDMKITYVIEDEPLGTAGAIKNVEQYITGLFFVLNGDILTSLDLKAMMAFHKEKRADSGPEQSLGALHLIRVDDPSAFGCVAHDASGRISAFIEKPPKGTAPTNEINAGTYLLEPEVLAMIPAGRNVSIERETFPKILAEGHPMYAYTTNDYWIDLGRPEHYLSAHRDILNGRMPLDLPLILEPGITGPGTHLHEVAAATMEQINRGANLEPPIHFDDGVHLAPTATIGPNVVVGKHCSIGDGAIVRESVLWEDVEIGDGAVVDECIIASRAKIGENARLGKGTVVGHDMIVEPGTIVGEGGRIGPAPRTAGALT